MELKSEEKNLWLLRHPPSVRWLCWLVMPSLLACSIYVFVIPFTLENFEIILFISTSFLTIPLVYICVITLQLFPYLSADVEFNREIIEIFWPSGKEKKYIWGEVAKVKKYPSLQMIVLMNSEGRTILAVTEQASSYKKFYEFALEISESNNNS